MKIKINKEKYYNNNCPSLTKKIMDVFYSKLMLSLRNKMSFDDIDIIESINIRINQAYRGCNTLHFYVSINGMSEVHMKVHNYDDPLWSFEGISDPAHPRGEWLCDFENHLNVDVGDHKIREKIKGVWDRRNAKSRSKKMVKTLKSKWEMYNKLKLFFD